MNQRPWVSFDIECYRNYFLVMFKGFATRKTRYFEKHDIGGGASLDVAAIRKILREYTVVSFNGRHYDEGMLLLALAGVTNNQLKVASDAIIQEGLKPWEFRDTYRLRVPDYLDHIDLFEVAPGMGSLKLYGARLHSMKLQDLPFDPDSLITAQDLAPLREYCNNDNDITFDLANSLKGDLQLRAAMSQEYGLDLRSKSDAQIAEAVVACEMEKRLGRKIERLKVPVGTTFKYQRPNFIAFQTESMQKMLAAVLNADFTVGKNGSVEMPSVIEQMRIRLGQGVYQMGIGGLHSTEKSQAVVCEEDHLLVDCDVASYYPAIILIQKLFPKQLGHDFLTVYKGIVNKRLKAKREGNKGVADTLKIVINGLFGKFGSKWSKVYSPALMIQTTLTGQLALLMLIEQLEAAGLRVVSANTDGVVIYCHQSRQRDLDYLLFDWELTTGFDLERNPYKALYSRDVNSYIAIKTDGQIKVKGEFSTEGLRNNPVNQICVDAVVAYLSEGTPVEETISECEDIRKFLNVRRVNGGGELVSRSLAAKTTVKEMEQRLEEAGWLREGKREWRRGDIQGSTRECYSQLLAAIERRYLGKVVRWYYGEDSTSCVAYKSNGNRVAKSEGCIPLMDLPETFPEDVDYRYYVNEAKAMLSRVGVVDG